MKKISILLVALVTVMLVSSCKSGCDCPGRGGYSLQTVEQPADNNI